MRPILPTALSEIQDVIIKTVSQECAIKDDEIILLLEEQYRLPHDKVVITQALKNICRAYQDNEQKKLQPQNMPKHINHLLQWLSSN